MSNSLYEITLCGSTRGYLSAFPSKLIGLKTVPSKGFNRLIYSDCDRE